MSHRENESTDEPMEAADKAPLLDLRVFCVSVAEYLPAA